MRREGRKLDCDPMVFSLRNRTTAYLAIVLRLRHTNLMRNRNSVDDDRNQSDRDRYPESRKRSWRSSLLGGVGDDVIPDSIGEKHPRRMRDM